MSMQKIVQKIWYPERNGSPPLTARLLSPLALLYGGIATLRNRLYDRGIFKTRRLPCPVVSVGNLTVGGTGKTPTVILIAKLLASSGRRPAILSRGYGGASRAPVNIVSDGRTVLMSPGDAGDEPVLIARKLQSIPVLTGPGRYLTGKAALQNFAVDVMILDDAFQHRELRRDLDIVLLDGRSPVGNGFTLPAGPLRETPAALRRADVIIATGDGESRGGRAFHSRFQHFLREGTPIFQGCHQVQDLIRGSSGDDLQPLAALRGKRLCAFSGIAVPESFRRSLQAAGGTITSFLAFPDHHPYTAKDICDINEAAQRVEADIIITTEKDGVKLQDFPDFMGRVFLLRIAMEIGDGRDDFPDLLRAKIAAWKRPEQPR